MQEIDEIKKSLEVVAEASRHYIVSSFAVAFITAVIRIWRDGTERTCSRMIQEATICGSITLTISAGIQAALVYLDTPPEKILAIITPISCFVGGFIGHMGSAWVRKMARKAANERIK